MESYKLRWNGKQHDRGGEEYLLRNHRHLLSIKSSIYCWDLEEALVLAFVLEFGVYGGKGMFA